MAKIISFLLLVVMLPVWAANDQTKTSSTTLIRLEIVNGCLLNNTTTNGLSLGTLNFGNIYAATAPVNANTAAGSGSIQLRCTPGTTARITIGAGLYGTGVNDRKMRLSAGVSTLNYQLYTSAARSTVWDDVTGVSILLSDDTTRTFPVYGRVPVQTTPTNGNYSDQVLVTLSY